MRKALLAVLVVLTTGAALNEVRLKHFDVERDGNAFVIVWETEVEDEVRLFEVFRKSGFDADFVPVGNSNGHGTNLEYRLTDDQVYKTSSDFIDYRLEVVYNNGVRQRLAEKKVNYTSTAIRRSWGSIKAMFQD